jgi:hypothetical protein
MKVQVNYRVIPVSGGGGANITIGGHTVNVAQNTVADVPYEIANSLGAKWVNCGKVGPTTSRPVGAANGEIFIDETLNAVIISAGNGIWHNPLTGSSV